MSLAEKIERAVDELPDDGEWWNSSGRETFIKTAKTLIKYEMPFKIVQEVLSDLYHATASEFGN